MSLYGNGSCDSVQAPEILTTMLGYAASANYLGKSVHASAGAGGSNGRVRPRRSITSLVLGLRAASCRTCSRRPGQARLIGIECCAAAVRGPC